MRSSSWAQLARQKDRIRVLLTLRDDFMMQAGNMPPLRGVLEHGVHLVGTPQRPELLRILVEPARLIGYEFESIELLEDMLAGVEERPGALALLSFTANRLWADRDREERQLTYEAYRAMGGVGGALARHADETVDGMPTTHRDLVRRAFRQLVTHRGTRAVLARAELHEVLGSTPRAQSVIETLIQSRLLVVWEGESGEDRIEIVHEALIDAWPRLVQWRSEDAQFARLRDQLRIAASQWDERDRPTGSLWRGDVLAEYNAWRSKYAGMLTETESAFAQASLSEASRGRRRLFLGTTTAIAVLILAIVIPVWLVAIARQDANKHSRDYLVEQGRLAIVADQPLRGLVFLKEAYQRGQRSSRLFSMIALAMPALEAQRASFDAHKTGVYIARFSPDGTRAVTVGGQRDSRAIVWDVTTGRRMHEFTEHSDVISSVAFSPDGERLLTASWDGTARVWNVERGEQINLFAHGPRIANARFSPDGRSVLTGDEPGTARLWDTDSGLLVQKFVTNAKDVFVAFNRTGTRIATGNAKQVIIWNRKTGERIAERESYDTRLLEFASCRGGDDQPECEYLLWVRDGAKVVDIWDTLQSAEPGALSDHRRAITSLHVSTDGLFAVTASIDYTAKIWNLQTGKMVTELLGHEGPLEHARFSRDGRGVITASADRTVRIWDTATGHELAKLIGHTDKVLHAELSASGEYAITASQDKTAKLWSTGTRGLLRVRPYPDATTVHAAVSPDGHLVAVSQDNQSVDLFAADTGDLQASQRIVSRGPRPVGQRARGRQIASLSPTGERIAIPDGARVAIVEVATGQSHYLSDNKLSRTDGQDDSADPGQILAAVFSHDGQRLVTAHSDGTARIWDVATGTPEIRLSGHRAEVLYAEFNHDGTRVVTASRDRTARIWDVTSGQLQTAVKQHTGSVRDARFAADGTLVITASLDGKIRIWPSDGNSVPEIVQADTRFHSVDISPDNTIIAAIDDDGLIAFWDRKTLQRIGTLGHVSAQGDWLSFDDTGTRLVTLTADRVIRIWDVDRTKYESLDLTRIIECRVPYRFKDNQIELKSSHSDECQRARETAHTCMIITRD